MQEMKAVCWHRVLSYIKGKITADLKEMSKTDVKFRDSYSETGTLVGKLKLKVKVLMEARSTAQHRQLHTGACARIRLKTQLCASVEDLNLATA